MTKTQELLELLSKPGHYLYIKVAGDNKPDTYYLLKVEGEIPDESGRTREGGQVHLTWEQFRSAKRTAIQPRVADAIIVRDDMAHSGFVANEGDDEPRDSFWFRRS